MQVCGDCDGSFSGDSPGQQINVGNDELAVSGLVSLALTAHIPEPGQSRSRSDHHGPNRTRQNPRSEEISGSPRGPGLRDNPLENALENASKRASIPTHQCRRCQGGERAQSVPGRVRRQTDLTLTVAEADHCEMVGNFVGPVR